MKAGQEHRELGGHDCVTEADRQPASARFRFRVRCRGSDAARPKSIDSLLLLLPFSPCPIRRSSLICVDTTLVVIADEYSDE